MTQSANTQNNGNDLIAANAAGLAGPHTTWFTMPKSRFLNLTGNLGRYEGHTGISQGPRATMVGSYSSPFAPADLNVGVLTDARNRVAF